MIVKHKDHFQILADTNTSDYHRLERHKTKWVYHYNNDEGNNLIKIFTNDSIESFIYELYESYKQFCKDNDFNYEYDLNNEIKKLNI